MAEETAVESSTAKAPFADFASRFCARLIDLGLLALFDSMLWGALYLGVVYGNLQQPSFALLRVLSSARFALYLGYFAVLTARSGQTLGKRFLGIQVQDASGGLPGAGMSTWRAFADFIFYTFSVLLIGLVDYLWMLRQKDSRTLHDLLARTTVRRIRPFPSSTSLPWLESVSVLIIMLSSGPHTMVHLTGVQRLSNMSPTINKGDQWEANLIAYRHRSPAVGDVVYFHGMGIQGAIQPVARVVGVAGDCLAFREGKVVHLPPPPQRAPWDADAVIVPIDCVAVLGDNHATSATAAFPGNPQSVPLVPPPPPPPPGAKAPPVPPPGFRWPGTPTASSPILTVRTKDVAGQVLGVTWPLPHIRTVR